MANPFPFASGEVLTAADMNSIGAWTDFTPSFTNFTLGNGTVNYCRYAQINDVVHVEMYISLGSTSSMSSSPTFTLPVTAADTFLAAGVGRARIGTFYWMFPYGTTTTTCGMYVLGASGTYATRESVTSTVPATWSSTSDFQLLVTYKAA